MADELDTSTPPAGIESEPTPEPDQTPEPTPDAEPEPEPTPQTPTPPTTDEIVRMAEERAFQRMASWQGRRDKDLFDNLGNLIDSRLRTAVPPPQPPPSTDPATVLENPDGWLRTQVPRLLDEVVNQRNQAEQQFNTELIRQAASAMDNDPLFTDKTLGNAVVEEIQRNFTSVNRNVPPAVAAQLLVNASLANVVRKQAQTRTNPLAGNKPASGPMGTVKPPSVPAQKAKPVKLTAEASALAKRWNYSDEDVARVFGEQ